MSFYEKYLELCAKAGKSPSCVALEISLSKTTVNRWKNGGGVTDATAMKVANYFGVSHEWLKGETDDPSAGIKKERPADGEARVCDLPESIQKIINICLDRPELASALLTLAQQIEKG